MYVYGIQDKCEDQLPPCSQSFHKSSRVRTALERNQRVLLFIRLFIRTGLVTMISHEQLEK